MKKTPATTPAPVTQTIDLSHHTPGPVGTQPLTPAQLRDLTLRANRQAKLAAKVEQKAATAAKRADGIIGTLRQALETEQGTTKTEIMATLTAKFADRDPLGMIVTVGIQLSRLPKALGRTMLKEKVEGRGLVYRFAPVVVTTPEA